MFVPTNERTFLRSPLGRCVVRRTFLVGCVPGLRVCVLWGEPDSTDVTALSRLLRVALHPQLQPPLVALTDASRLARVDEAAFKLLRDFVTAHDKEFARVIAKQAIVRSEAQTLAATAAVGFYATGKKPFVVGGFTHLPAALKWLGRSDVATEASALARFVDQQTTHSGIVGRVREHLDQHLVGASLENTARSLAMTARTFRRALERAGTSFRRELEAARIRAAQRLLDDDRIKIGEVAARSGFSSRQRLSAALRRGTGMTPRQWRARLG